MKEKIIKLTENIYIRGGLLLTIASFIVNILNYFFHFLAGRFLGPSGYGEITTLYSYISITSVPLMVISTVIMQKISAQDTDQFIYVKSLETFFWKLTKRWSFFIIPVLLIIPLTPQVTNLTTIVAYALIPFVLLSFVGSFYNSVLQGLKLFLIYSLLGIANTIIKLLSIIPAIFNIYDASGVIIFQLLFSLLTLSISIHIIRKKIMQHHDNQSRIINKRLLIIFADRQFLITLISLIGITILTNLDIIFVKKFFSAQESGIYNSWNLFAKIITYIVGPIIPVSFVFFASGKNKLNQNKILFLSLGALLIFCLISYFGYSVFGGQLTNLLFGNKFNTIIPYLGLASIFGSFYTMIIFINNFFLAKKSAFSVILLIILPIYGIFLYLIPRALINIMYLNIFFSLSVVIIYFLAFTYQFYVKLKI